MAIKVDLSYGNLFRLAVALISVAMVIYHIWAIAFGSPEAFQFRGTHLLFAMMLVFLLYRRSGDAGRTADTARLCPARPRRRRRSSICSSTYDYVVNRIFYVDELTLVGHDDGRAPDRAGARGDAPGDRLGAADHGDGVSGSTRCSSRGSSRSICSTSCT